MNSRNINLSKYLTFLRKVNRLQDKEDKLEEEIKVVREKQDMYLYEMDLIWLILTPKEREEANRNQTNTSGS